MTTTSTCPGHPPVFPSRAPTVAERASEPPRQASRTRSGRQTGDRRPDRRRQIRHHVPGAGAPDARHAGRRRRRSERRARNEPAQDRRLAGWELRRGFARRGAQEARRLRHRQRRSADRRPAHRGDRGGDRRSRRRHPSLPARDRKRQAHRHGQCGGRRGGRPAAGAPRQGGGRGLFAGLGRPAGADLRACRLGARRRLQGHRGRQGHALRAALPPVQSRQCLGHPRQVLENHRPQFDQSQDVQLFRRRHQIRHRDDRGVQRHRPGAAVGRPQLPAGHPLRARRDLQAEERRRHAGKGRRHRGHLPRSIATGATCRIIWRSVLTSCSRARPNTRAAASGNIPCCRTRPANTPRSTGRST